MDSEEPGSSRAAGTSARLINEDDVTRLIQTTIADLRSEQQVLSLPEKFRVAGINDQMYNNIARAELECLKALLTSFGLEIRIEQLSSGSYFCFRLFRGGDQLGYTSCVVMGNEAVPMLPVRCGTKEHTNMEENEIKYPVVQMEFTEMTSNGFNGAEIIQRYIMCLCAMNDVHLMIKDIMTDLAGFKIDWNKNIGCNYREVAFNAVKPGSYESSFDEWARSQNDSQSSTSSKFASQFSESISASQCSRTTLSSDSSSNKRLKSDASSQSSYASSSSCGSSSSSCGSSRNGDSDDDPYRVVNEGDIPELTLFQINELIKYFVFQYNDEIQGLLIKMQSQQMDYLNSELQKIVQKTRSRVTRVASSYFGEMYSDYEIVGDDDRNKAVEAAKEKTMQKFLDKLNIFLDGIGTTPLNQRSGKLADFDCSSEAILFIDRLFSSDITDSNFIDNIVKIARKMQTKLQPNSFVESVFVSHLNSILMRVVPQQQQYMQQATASESAAFALPPPRGASAFAPPTSTPLAAAAPPPPPRGASASEAFALPLLAAQVDARFSLNRKDFRNQAGNTRGKKKGGGSTKKKQHKNKRSSKRKKNKKYAIKTQKNKRNKTRK